MDGKNKVNGKIDAIFAPIYFFALLFVGCLVLTSVSAEDINVVVNVSAGCGDGICTPAYAENITTCPEDCIATGGGGRANPNIISEEGVPINAWTFFEVHKIEIFALILIIMAFIMWFVIILTGRRRR